jgi:hypothetical protein
MQGSWKGKLSDWLINRIYVTEIEEIAKKCVLICVSRKGRQNHYLLALSNSLMLNMVEQCTNALTYYILSHYIYGVSLEECANTGCSRRNVPIQDVPGEMCQYRVSQEECANTGVPGGMCQYRVSQEECANTGCPRRNVPIQSVPGGMCQYRMSQEECANTGVPGGMCQTSGECSLC